MATESDSTRWSIIREAAEGGGAARSVFAQRYQSVIRAYLGARWRQTPLMDYLEDAAQDVFVDCFKDGGALGRAEDGRPGGFRAYLHGIVRNVARRHEEGRYRGRERAVGGDSHLQQIAAREEASSRIFDRAWAQAPLRQAAELQAARARESGEQAVRRVELLRLRFVEGLPIREIAKQWEEEPDRVHYHYKRARGEFKAALRKVVSRHDPSACVEEECARLLGLLD